MYSDFLPSSIFSVPNSMAIFGQDPPPQWGHHMQLVYEKNAIFDEYLTFSQK